MKKEKSAVVRRISAKRINSYLRKLKSIVKREDKISQEIEEIYAKVSKTGDAKLSSIELTICEYELTNLGSKLKHIESTRIEAEQKYTAAINHNNSLNTGDAESPVLATV